MSDDLALETIGTMEQKIDNYYGSYGENSLDPNQIDNSTNLGFKGKNVSIITNMPISSAILSLLETG